MEVPEAPIVVVEGRDIAVYDSATSAEARLESPDIENGIYRLYDAIGRKLCAVFCDPSSKRPNAGLAAGIALRDFRLVVEDSSSASAEELRKVLAGALAATTGKSVDECHGLSLPKLIDWALTALTA